MPEQPPAKKLFKASSNKRIGRAVTVTPTIANGTSEQSEQDNFMLEASNLLRPFVRNTVCGFRLYPTLCLRTTFLRQSNT